jgi:hypothetical protein
MITSRLAVTTPAETYDLVTVEEARAEVGGSVPPQTAELTRWIRQASDAVAHHCRRVFALETVTETFRLSSRADIITLARLPVSAIASVTENGEVLAAEDCECHDESGLLVRLRAGEPTCWPRGTVTVVYAGGYSLPDALPDDIARAALMLVQQYARGGRDPLIRRETLDVLSREFFPPPDGLPLEVETLLAPHRAIPVP